MKKLIIVLALVLSGAAAQARECTVVESDGYFTFKFGQGSNARYPTMRELFDLMQEKEIDRDTDEEFSPLFYALEQSRVLLQTNDGSWTESGFNSIPTRGNGDPACIRKDINGYECRDIQVKQRKGISKGIEAPVKVLVKASNQKLKNYLEYHLGCVRGAEAPGGSAAPATATQSAGSQAGAVR